MILLISFLTIFKNKIYTLCSTFEEFDLDEEHVGEISFSSFCKIFNELFIELENKCSKKSLE